MNNRCSIFISYRRSDVPGYVRALMSDLRNSFGSKHVFLDIETIEAGSDFTDIIEKALEGCEVLLAVIGPHWLTASNECGHARIHDPNDFIKLEIAGALNRKIPVIPVLMNQAIMPNAEDLPLQLQALASLQAVSLSHERWDDDMEKLITAIDNLTVAPRLARQYDAAKHKLKQGFWKEALIEFNAIESVKPNYGNILEILPPLRELAHKLSESGPEVRRWQRFALKHPMPLIMIVTLIPHILAAVFNYIFNWQVIVHPMQLRGVKMAELVFEMYAISLNSVLFLIGIAILILLVRPINKGLKALAQGLAVTHENLSDLRDRCLRLGHLIALYGLSIWIIAGPIYPILIGALEVRDYVFFITSLAISGLAVSAYPFMLVTSLCAHVFYRPLTNPGLSSELENKLLDQVDTLKWRYFLLTGALPMLVISLGFILGPFHSTPQLVSTLLGIVGLIGLAGFFLALLLFKGIQNDLDLLRELISACGSKHHQSKAKQI